MIDSGDLEWDGDEPGNDQWFARRYSTRDIRAVRTIVGAAINDRGVVIEPITNKPLPERSFYTTVEWEESYAESCEGFLKTTLPHLEKVGPPDSVRIIFWFDN